MSVAYIALIATFSQFKARAAIHKTPKLTVTEVAKSLTESTVINEGRFWTGTTIM